MLHKLLCKLGIHWWSGPQRYDHSQPFTHEVCFVCSHMKQIVGWIWSRTWLLVYGRRRGWGLAIWFEGLRDGSVAYAAVLPHGDGTLTTRWFWRRDINGRETLGQ